MRLFILPALLSAWSFVTVSAQIPSRIDDCQPCSSRKYPDLLEADLETLVAGLEDGLFTSQDLVAAYTARIELVNGELNVVSEINPDAMDIAATTDALRSNGTVVSPLHGIPILIKDNIATNDKMNNTAGSYGLVGAQVPRDSTVAAKLRRAGAIILGKTNLSQWANYRSGNSSNGWSAYGGQVRGAYYPNQDPSGSSSGSGVASSIGLALAALGTETSGSILSPAQVNNLVGIKPTVGLTSRYLVIPISEHQDTVGPMTRTVKDAAYVLQAIAGPDPNDNYTSAIPFNNSSFPDYVGACKSNALAGKRLGLPYNVLEAYSEALDPYVLTSFYAAVQQMIDAGATIVEANFTAFDDYRRGSSSGTILGADFVTNLPSYLASLTFNPNNISSVAQLRTFTQAFPAEDFPERDTEVWDNALALGFDNTSPDFWSVYQRALSQTREGGILGALRRANASAVLLPSDVSPGIPAVAGSPVITVPLGFSPRNTTVEMNRFGNLVAEAPGLPYGISFLGDWWAEAELIGLAYAYEQRTRHREERRPYIVPNVGLEDVV